MLNGTGGGEVTLVFSRGAQSGILIFAAPSTWLGSVKSSFYEKPALRTGDGVRALCSACGNDFLLQGSEDMPGQTSTTNYATETASRLVSREATDLQADKDTDAHADPQSDVPPVGSAVGNSDRETNGTAHRCAD